MSENPRPSVMFVISELRGGIRSVRNTAAKPIIALKSILGESFFESVFFQSMGKLPKTAPVNKKCMGMGNFSVMNSNAFDKVINPKTADTANIARNQKFFLRFSINVFGERNPLTA